MQIKYVPLMLKIYFRECAQLVHIHSCFHFKYNEIEFLSKAQNDFSRFLENSIITFYFCVRLIKSYFFIIEVRNAYNREI